MPIPINIANQVIQRPIAIVLIEIVLTDKKKSAITAIEAINIQLRKAQNTPKIIF